MTKLKTEVVVKSGSAKEERCFVNPPYTVFVSPSMPESNSIVMKVGGLRQMLEGLDDDDSFRIQWFVGNRATEYSYIKKDGKKRPRYNTPEPKLKWDYEN